MKHSRPKKQTMLAMLPLVVCLTFSLSSCSGRETSGEPPSQAPVMSQEARGSEKKTMDKISEELSALGYEAELRTELASRVEINARDAEANYVKSAGAPEKWSEVIESLSSASSRLSGKLGLSVAIYLNDKDDETLLTVSDGKVFYNAFDEAFAPTENNLATISKAEFDAIREGMGYQEVFDLVGSAGTVMSESGTSGSAIYAVLYSWEGEGSIGANANVMFQGGVVVSKAQFGLE